MKPVIKILILLACLFQLTSLAGQELELDTVFVKKKVGENEFELDTLFIESGNSSPQVLTGTTFLPYSEKMIALLNKGLSPISLKVIQTCDEKIDPNTFEDYPKFKEVSRTSNQLTIAVSIVANCCHNFLGEAEIIGTDTLNLIYTAYGGFCGCRCCYTLEYTFNTTLADQYQVLKYVTINGSETVVEIIKKE
ncbi:MAG: hypothetical protein AB8G15_16105 [Saprospiraceae bacterium]